MGGKRIIGPAITERTPMHVIRDAILRMTWRDLEGLAELIEEQRVETNDQTAPVTGAMLNSFASQLELDGDER